MYSPIAKVLLVGTSFSPVLLTLAYVEWYEGHPYPYAYVYLAVAFLLVALCLLLITAGKKQFEVLPFKVTSVKTADSEIISYVLAYLLPLASADGGLVKPGVLYFILAILILVVWSTHAYHFNPVLAVFGYHLYEVTDESNVSYVMVTKRELRNTEDVSKVALLTEYMVLDLNDN